MADKSDPTQLPNPSIRIFGVPTIDWLNIADNGGNEGLGYWPLGRGKSAWHLSAQPGGSALLCMLLKQMLPDELLPFKGISPPNISTSDEKLIKHYNDLHKMPYKSANLDTSVFDPLVATHRHNWTLWKKYPKTKKDEFHDVYRMSGWNDRENDSKFSSFDELSSLNTPGLIILDDPGWKKPDLSDDEAKLLDNYLNELLPKVTDKNKELKIKRDNGEETEELQNELSKLTEEADKCKAKIKEKKWFEDYLKLTPESQNWQKEFLKWYVSIIEVAEKDFSSNTPDIILKLAPENSPDDAHLNETVLFSILNSNAALCSKTTILTNVRSLRAELVRIGMSLSWERMLDDIVRAVNTRFERRFRRVIVTIGLCGVVIIDNQSNPGQTLVFDRALQEGDFENEHEGNVLGYSTCMMAALATAWAECHRYKKVEPQVEAIHQMNWAKAARNGLHMMRLLHKDGYRLCHEPVGRPTLEMPLDSLEKEYYRQPFPETSDKGDESEETYNKDKDSLGTYTIAPEYREKSDATNWSILHQDMLKKADENPFDMQELVFERAKQIITEGPNKALHDVPVETIGGWQSADRNEIEGVRSVNNAMRDYLSGKSNWLAGKSSDMKPLSIGVFGPPGAGKSYAVKQIASRLRVDKDAQLEFNLSQYATPDDLAKAFHEVRDKQLQGHIPLVFWDEFDSMLQNRSLGWLPYFLMPMQDAKFSERGVLHPVGPAIYVFAGGTYSSFKKFVDGSKEEQGRNAKQPDFISRLRAFIDVKGPNRNEDRDDPNQDKFFMIRRALLLHSSLTKNAKPLSKDGGFRVQPGVINAFLRTRIYLHGARSLDTLVEQSIFRDKSTYEMSSLPSTQQMQNCVDVDDFMNCLYKVEVQ